MLTRLASTRGRILLLGVAITFLVLGIPNVIGVAGGQEPGGQEVFFYTVKLICVPELGPTQGVVEPFATYKTAVNLHNPGDSPAHILQWITTSPPIGQESVSSGRVPEDLASMAAYDISCQQLEDVFGLPKWLKVPGGKGFVLIRSDQALEVRTVYTATRVGGFRTDIDVETTVPLVFHSEVPTPLTASPTLLPDNNLIVRIEGILDMPGEVYVQYRPILGTEALQTRAVPSDGTDYVVHVTRLKPATAYLYDVFGKSADGKVSQGAGGIFITLPLPEGLKGASYKVTGGQPSKDLTLMEFSDNDFGGIVAIDSDGEIVWYYDVGGSNRVGPVAQKPNGNIVYLLEDALSPASAFSIREITPLGEEVARVDAECSPRGPWHHEVSLLPDNKVMFLSRDIQDSFDDPTRLQEGDTINIWDQSTGDVTTVWNVFDFIDPATDRTPDSDLSGGVMWKGCSGEEPAQDWTHGNSARMAQDGSVIYSARHLDQVVSIAPDFQSLNWRLGGPGGDFSFSDPSDRFYHQHSAVPLPNGNILLFDNGNGRPEEEGGEYSRALELELDLSTMEARKVWEYRHAPALYAACCSNVSRLENGNTLIVFGADFSTPECCRTFTIVEADPQGNAVWIVEHTSSGKDAQYRVYPNDSIMGETRVSGP